ncbi:unnamed protein product [Mytilus coruscus]|uniref:Uncharacterized protein n=1 Tax=Mytilus coruscus TaxID=42192 RepID=A0A6J8F0K9_MYTCO|nr:unnamed protein product [Mytilus coruscus]
MDLNKLKSIRKANRSVVTRHLRKIKDLKNAAELARVDLLATFESEEEKKKLLNDLNQQILNAIDSEDIEDEILNTDEYTLDLETKLKHLRIFIQSLDNSNNHTNQQSTSYQTLNYESPPFIPTSCIENQQHRGTTDIVIQKKLKDGKLKDLCKPCGDECGGTHVDKEFMKVVSQILGNDVMIAFKRDYPLDYLELRRALELIKQADPEKKIRMSVPLVVFDKICTDHYKKTFIDILKQSKWKDSYTYYWG